MTILTSWKALLILCALSLFLLSCQTCRKTSIDDARYWESKGYQTRVAVYRVGWDGKIMGLGIWEFHAQAQVFINGEWKWADGDSVSERPMYTIDNDIWYWQVNIYQAVLEQQGKYN